MAFTAAGYRLNSTQPAVLMRRKARVLKDHEHLLVGRRIQMMGKEYTDSMKKTLLALTFTLALLSASSFNPKPQADAGCCCPCFPQSKCNPQPNGGWTCDGGAERVQVLKDAARCLVRKFK